MVRLNRITTRTGDDGSTGLADGSRVRKDSPRIEACGTVDELNCILGMVLRACRDGATTTPAADAASGAGASAAGELASLLARIQNDLFDVGADLATPGDAGTRLAATQVAALEARVHAVNEHLAPLTSFVLPGGSALACWLHLGRAVCRRAERCVVALAAAEPVGAQVVPYLNRLSDLLFVLARAANRDGTADVLWEPGRFRE